MKKPTSSKKYILAIDLGTSGPKLHLVSSEFDVLAWSISQLHSNLIDNGGVNKTHTDWWEAVRKASKEVLSKNLSEVQRCWQALSCTAQWSGTVCLDEKGKVLAPAMIWMDSRGAEQVKNLNKSSLKVSGYDPFKLISWRMTEDSRSIR